MGWEERLASTVCSASCHQSRILLCRIGWRSGLGSAQSSRCNPTPRRQMPVRLRPVRPHRAGLGERSWGRSIPRAEIESVSGWFYFSCVSRRWPGMDGAPPSSNAAGVRASVRIRSVSIGSTSARGVPRSDQGVEGAAAMRCETQSRRRPNHFAGLTGRGLIHPARITNARECHRRRIGHPTRR